MASLIVNLHHIVAIPNTGGAAAEALPYLQQAQQRFEVLGERGARMASVSLTEQGDCLTDLGKLELAAAAYQEAIKRSEKLEDTRGVAVTKGQLATIRIMQKDYPVALQGYREALELFQQLDEPGAVATIYHQIGVVYKGQAQFDQAESAYRQSLSIETKRANRAGEASSLGELANLYNAWNRPEQAVDYYRQAADIATELGDLAKEGIRRSNLANTLKNLNRLDEARPELLRAIECKKSLGHAAEPWKTWAILYDLEQADGNLQAAHKVRQKANLAYLAYRRDGGENHNGIAPKLCGAVLEGIQQNKQDEIASALTQKLEETNQAYLKALIPKLQSILAGDRNPAVAEDDELDYDDAVELKLLLEQLQ